MQHAVLEALEKNPEYPEEMCAEFKSRRDLICDRLNAMPGVTCHVPTGAFYVFPKIEIPGMNSEEIALKLLEGGVLVHLGQLLVVPEKGTLGSHIPSVEKTSPGDGQGRICPQ